ncbi:MAG: FAD-binding protein [Candidatus Aminicenantes bacterium]|nr:MAG: FAD-binding protein [Candidatus Aminicenantes bacterium]
MGFKLLELKMPTDFTPGELKQKIAKKLHIKDFSYTIDKQSLDARNKHHIHWKIRVGVSSTALKGPEPATKKMILIPYEKREKRVIVVGSGPAGFFAGYTLLLAGFKVILLEQGPEVNIRFKDIISFERTGELNERSNYAFGEGGAGTFSDGKLTSRTKTISTERQFIFDTYIDAGAPREIAYLAHPHLGSDNLRKIVKNQRKEFFDWGGNILFDTRVEDIFPDNEHARIRAVETNKGKMEADYFVFAVGHSSYETYRMLIKKDIPFGVKSFAIGCRVEHMQEVINRAQWGRSLLPGVKAAEYRLTFKPQDKGLLPVYSFCMCPGGRVVPSAVYKNTNIVNGMSNYRRNAPFANAGVVAGINLNRLLNKRVDPLEALEWLEVLEKKFFDFSNSYAAPACKIRDFLEGKVSHSFNKTSYPFGLVPADFNALFPGNIVNSLKPGIKDFCGKIKGFEEGVMLGLESKTSSPLRAIRDRKGKSPAFGNLYISGEGSGYAGGIVSSAADGIKAAVDIIASGGPAVKKRGRD